MGAPPVRRGNGAREEALQTPFGHDNDLLPIRTPDAPMDLREVRAAGRTHRVWALCEVRLGAAPLLADSRISLRIGPCAAEPRCVSWETILGMPGCSSALGAGLLGGLTLATRVPDHLSSFHPPHW